MSKKISDTDQLIIEQFCISGVDITRNKHTSRRRALARMKAIHHKVADDDDDNEVDLNSAINVCGNSEFVSMTPMLY